MSSSIKQFICLLIGFQLLAGAAFAQLSQNNVSAVRKILRDSTDPTEIQKILNENFTKNGKFSPEKLRRFINKLSARDIDRMSKESAIEIMKFLLRAPEMIREFYDKNGWEEHFVQSLLSKRLRYSRLSFALEQLADHWSLLAMVSVIGFGNTIVLQIRAINGPTKLLQIFFMAALFSGALVYGKYLKTKHRKDLDDRKNLLKDLRNSLQEPYTHLRKDPLLALLRACYGEH